MLVVSIMNTVGEIEGRSVILCYTVCGCFPSKHTNDQLYTRAVAFTKVWVDLGTGIYGSLYCITSVGFIRKLLVETM